MSEIRNLTIKGADKSGKIAIMETEDYLEHCELLLNYREFYGKLDANPTQIYTQEVKQKIDEKKKLIHGQCLFITFGMVSLYDDIFFI